MAQALTHHDSRDLLQDVFFKFGSQDSYTIATQYYSLALALLDVQRAPLVLWLTNEFLFVISLWLCFAEIWPRYKLPYTLLGVAMSLTYYGGDNVFAYSETFFTARNLAEPISLMGFTFMLRQRRCASGGALLFAAVIHPLTAAPCLVLWWVCQKNHLAAKFAVTTLAACLASALCVAHVHPFDDLTKSYDKAWWIVVSERTPFVDPLNWTLANWLTLLIDSAIVYSITVDLAASEARRFLRLVVVIGVGGVAFSLIATSLCKNVLLTGLQPWRSHWVLHLFAAACTPLLLKKLWDARGLSRIASLFFVVALVRYPNDDAFYVVALGVAVCVAHSLYKTEMPTGSRRWLMVGLVLIISMNLALYALQLYDIWFGVRFFPYTKSQQYQMSLALPATRWGIVITASILFFWFHCKKLGWTVLAIAGAVYVSQLDQRDAWQRYIFEHRHGNNPLAQYIRPGQQIYWNWDVIPAWFMLGVPSYYTAVQGSGVLFHRETAMEFARRKELLGVPMRGCKTSADYYFNSACRFTSKDVKRVCTHESSLAAMVFSYPIDGLAYVEFAPALEPDDEQARYWLFRCDQFKSGGT